MNRGAKYWLRLLITGIVGGIVLAGIGIELVYVLNITQPAPSLVGEPKQLDIDRLYQPVTLANKAEDIELSAWYLPTANGATIILLHGFGNNRLEMKARADVLAQHGYGVLLYDLRGHGESGGNIRAFGWQDVADVNAALAFLFTREEVDPGRIGILGFSVGGQIALRAAAAYKEIKAVIADDPGFVTIQDAPKTKKINQKFMYLVSWIDAMLVSLRTGIPVPPGITDSIGKISPRPILFIDTGQGLARDLVRHFYELAGEPKELFEIPETYHGGQFKARPMEYEERMIAFFDRALLGD